MDGLLFTEGTGKVGVRQIYDKSKCESFYGDLTRFDPEDFVPGFGVYWHREERSYYGPDLPFCDECGVYTPSGYLVNKWLDLKGVEFEHAMKYALDRTELFDSSEVLPGSGDYGADIILEDSRGRYVFQLKNWRDNPCGLKSVQEILAAKAYYDASWAGVITTARSFSRSAETMADKCDVQLIRLGDIDLLNNAIGCWLYSDCTGERSISRLDQKLV